jgi:hypothetical protein
MSEMAEKSPSNSIILSLAALFGSIPYFAAKLLFIPDAKHENPLFDVITGVLAITFTVVFTQLIIKKRDGIATFKTLFLPGWAASFLFCVISIVVIQIYFHYQHNIAPPKAYILIMLMKFNALGMIISSILAFVLKTK